MLLLLRHIVELDQCELDLLVPAIAALLVFAGTEHARDVVDIAEHDVEQAAPAGRLEIGNRAFEHVAGAIELVIVAEVGPALVDLAPDIPAVQIAVRKLRLGKVFGDRIDLRFDAGSRRCESA